MTTPARTPFPGPVEPAWVLDVAEAAVAFGRQRLIAAMLERDEDVTDRALWRLRRSQLDELLQSGKVLAVRHQGSEPVTIDGGQENGQ